MRGTVKWFNETRGFGFLTGENGEDLFVHFREVERRDGERLIQLAEGEAVEYEEGEDQRGRRCAVRVRRVGQG